MAPDLSEHRSDSDKILHYAKQDYVIGESSQGMLQRIAQRLNNGPSPAQVLPELDSSDLESQMAELSRQRSAAREFSVNSHPVELDGVSHNRFELDAGPAIYPPQQATRFPDETISSRLSDEVPNGRSSGQFSERQDVQADNEHASSSASRQVVTADRKWEGGFF